MVIEIGQRVSVPSKDVGNGKIVFYGPTEFAKGQWIGIILDERKGKNNGTIQGIQYFDCEENYGMFVREQLIAPEQPKKLPTGFFSLLFGPVYNIHFSYSKTNFKPNNPNNAIKNGKSKSCGKASRYFPVGITLVNDGETQIVSRPKVSLS